MNRNFYSDRTVESFVKNTVCQRDPILYRYFENEDRMRFRRRLEILKVNPSDIEKAVYAYVTDSIRDIILDTIGKLTRFLKPMGDLVISGGEGFNFYFDRDSRVVTSDIDTKFVPRIARKGLFEGLQATKLLLWNELGRMSKVIEPRIKARIDALKVTRLSKVLGISLPTTGPIVTRRYTMIKKSKQSPGASLNVTPRNVMIDVELFTLDLKIRYFSTKEGSIKDRNLGGILDIAFMRPGELGYDVGTGKTRGVMYKNQLTNKIIYNQDVTIASKRFLVEDLYLMQSLGLRTDKKEKDRKRMVEFARKVLDIKNVSASDSIESIYKKAIKILPVEPKRARKIATPLNRTLIKRAERVNPAKWANRTTKPSKGKLARQLLIGLKGPEGLTIKGFTPTSGKYRFNLKTQKWVRDTRTSYIKDEFNYRPSEDVSIAGIKLKPSQILYGYNPIRDRGMSRRLMKKASQIPLIGLKN
jgi:hypothetical protein